MEFLQMTPEIAECSPELEAGVTSGAILTTHVLSVISLSLLIALMV